MNRTSLTIVAGIAVASVLLAIVGQRGSSPDTTAGTLLLPGLLDSLNDVERIVVSKAGSEVVATLTKTDSGWTVAEKDGYPADVAQIRSVLVALAEARILEEKTADPQFYDRLGVESIDLETASGTAIAIDAPNAEIPVLILGDSVNDSYRYVRRVAEERSFMIDRDPEIPRNMAQWLVPDIVDLRGTRVQRVTITHPDGETLVISKASPDDANFAVADVPDGRELLYPGVANMVGNALRELKLEDVARAEQDSAEPAVLSEFRTFDGLIVTLTGRRDGDEAWVTFAAGVDAAQAAAAGAQEDAPAVAGDEAAPAPQAEAEALNAKLGGWRFRIAAHQFDQLTRRLADLLKPPA